MNMIWVFLGAGFGGVFRYLVTAWTYTAISRHFPWATLLVNASGSFLMGLFFVLILNKYVMYTPQLRLFLLVGFLGGYTTFSSFSFDTWYLFESGEWMAGLANIVLNIVLCLSLTWLGILWGRQIN